jgi:phospholipid/cholesterol/gamma-HCH transport system substrate-binding protein
VAAIGGFDDRIRSHRLGLTALLVVLALGATVTLASGAVPTRFETRSLCAEFRDASGLYTGNKVKLLGIDVGTVTAIRNEPAHVRVDFTVPRDLDLPSDVGAVTYGDSIVTDRHVELTKPYDTGPTFTGPGCIAIDSTKTPIGIS